MDVMSTDGSRIFQFTFPMSARLTKLNSVLLDPEERQQQTTSPCSIGTAFSVMSNPSLLDRFNIGHQKPNTKIFVEISSGLISISSCDSTAVVAAYQVCVELAGKKTVRISRTNSAQLCAFVSRSVPYPPTRRTLRPRSSRDSLILRVSRDILSVEQQGVEYSGLEDSKATTPHDQATALPAQTEVYTADSADPPNDAEETSAGSPPSPDRKRPSDESPTISPPTERTPPKRPLLHDSLSQETPPIAYPEPGDLVRFEHTPIPAHAPSLMTTTPIVELEGSPASNPIAPTDEPWPLALRLLHSQAQQATAIQQELQNRQAQLLIENGQLVREHAALIEHARLLEETRQNDFRTIASQLQERYEQETSVLRMELETKYQEVCEVLQCGRIASNLQIQEAMATISDLNNQLLVAHEQLMLQSSTERTAAQVDQIRLQEVQTLNEA
ncbi:hypothetical protein AC1031_007844 [Aphanomyces cochlioides]|nr:hypothetical protein AC1031_007844 [Aphanomyces cochlioides]